MEILEIGKEILEKINTLGYLAYMVGGTVRDYLLHLEINDCDMTTNMPLEEIRHHFDCIDNGLKYQSVTILYKGYSFEITHFRKDISYSDHRHPEVCLVNSYLEDSSRRDFTVNALAMDKDGNILDYHEGLKDLHDKMLRTIGNPFTRFEEDALRILRGLYFSSKLDFELDSDTLFAMVDKKELLSTLSEERIYQYFIKILYASTDRGIRYINECDIFQYIPKFKRWLNLVDKSMKEEDLIFYYYGARHQFPMTPKKEEERLSKSFDILSKNLDSYTLYKYKEDYFKLRDILKYFGCDIMKADERVNTFVIKTDKELAISKEEIAVLFLGTKKGMAIEHILKCVLNHEIENTKEAILNELGRLKLCLKE